uniref:hypothetical protein n=1 Tax=Proteus faecis TaxID=2050967 RepID=UPI001E5B5972
MDVSGITKKVNTAISNVNINLNNKWTNLKNLKFIKNTNLSIKYSYNNKGQHIPLPSIDEYIKTCANLLNNSRDSTLVSKDNTPDAVSKDNTSDAVSKGNTSDAVSKGNTSDAVSKGNTSDAVSKGNTSDAVSKGNTSDAV